MHATYQQNLDNGSSFSRWLSSVPPAIAFTFALLAIMVKLVLIEIEEPAEESGPQIDPPLYEKTIIEDFPDVPMAKKPKIDPIPDVPERVPEVLDGNEIAIPTFDKPTAQDAGPNFKFTGMPIPQFLAAAKYPVRASNKGIEGYVDVIFDITKAGSTKNIRVVSASPAGVFDKSALAAVKRWRYQPQMKEGEAVVYIGMRQRIRFVMEGSKDA